MSTYADHQEDAAQGLRQLIARDILPTTEDSIRSVLGCREAVLDAISDRLGHLGLAPPRHRPTIGVPGTVEQLPDNAAQLLPEVLRGAPRLRPEDRPRPSTALNPTSGDPAADQWAAVGADLMAANKVLENSAERPWRADPGAAWYAVGDLADTIEAITVLDDRLDETGILAGLVDTGDRIPTETARVITAECARYARWYGTNPAADLAHDPSQPPRTPAEGIHLVNTPRDLAPAQHRLGTYLSRLSAGNAHAAAGDTRLDAFTTRALARNQMNLMQQLATITDRRPSMHEPNAAFRLLRDQVAEVRMRSGDLVDATERTRSPQLLIWQQQEISRAATTGSVAAGLRSMSLSEVTALAHASHSALTNFGQTLRYELLRDDSGLRYRDRGEVVGPTRDYHHSPLNRAAVDLANVPSPGPIQPHWKTPTARTALRSELDQTPAHQRAPSPFGRQDPRRLGR